MPQPGRKLVGGCLVLLAVAVPTAPAATDRSHPLACPAADEYVFEGKPLGAWVAHLKHQDPDVRLNAALAFRRMGPRARQAAGALVAALKDEDALVCRYTTDALARIGRPAVPLLVAALKERKARLQVVIALEKIGPGAEAAVKPLVNLLRDSDLPGEEGEARRRARFALGRIGKPAVGPLVRALNDKDPMVRMNVVFALEEVGPAAEAAVTPLAAVLGDEDFIVRAAAAGALGAIHGKPEVAIPSLTEALGDEDFEVRCAARRALAQFGKAALPSLLEALKGRSPAMREQAAAALGHVSCEDGEVVRPLIAALRDKNLQVRWAAADALMYRATRKTSGMPGPLAEAVPALIGTFKDRQMCGYFSVSTALAHLGGKPVPPLVQSLQDENADVRRAAIEALGKMGSRARNAVPAIIERLQDKDKGVRNNAAWALASLGPVAEEAVPALARALKDKDLRTPAVHALGRIGNASLPVLLASWSKGKAEERAEIASALALIGPKAEPALPLLIEALRDRDARLCEAAAYAVSALGTAGRPAVPGLTLLLQQGEFAPRCAAVRALKCLGPEAEEALPALIMALQDKGSLVRLEAADALGKFGHRAKDAVVPLIAARRVKEPDLRQRAARALWEIDPAAARKVGIPREPDDELEDDK